MMDLRVTPLGSYDILLGMDWLDAHQAKIGFHRKIVECMDDQGISVMISGIHRPISLCMISAMQLKRCLRKGF